MTTQDTVWVQLANNNRGEGLIGWAAEGERKGKIAFFDLTGGTANFVAGNFLLVRVNRDRERTMHVSPLDFWAPRSESSGCWIGKAVAFPGPLVEAKKAREEKAQELLDARRERDAKRLAEYDAQRKKYAEQCAAFEAIYEFTDPERTGTYSRKYVIWRRDGEPMTKLTSEEHGKFASYFQAPPFGITLILTPNGKPMPDGKAMLSVNTYTD